jgi:hypothetical protein
MRLINLVGQRFGRLVVTGRSGSYGHGRSRTRPLWSVACDCGGTAVVMGQNLRAGRTKSCGCQMGNRR